MIQIKEDWCKGCDLCIDKCPLNALEQSEHLNKRGVKPPQLKKINDCNYCRLCELICPDLAIAVIKDKNKKTEEKKSLLRPVGGRK